MNQAAPYVGDTTRSLIVTASIGAIVFSFLSIGFQAAYLPKAAPLTLPVTFLVISCLLSATAVFLLSRRTEFAWTLFLAVSRWVLVLTGIFAVMAIYIFVADGTRGKPLAILVAVLVLAAINIPMLLGFSVARHERVAA